MNNISSNKLESKLILLSVGGMLIKPVDLEMLSFTINNNLNINEPIYKFIGYNNIYFTKLKDNENINDIIIKPQFYNQCSFFLSPKKSIKIYRNGSFHASGFESINEVNNFIQYILDNFINKTKFIKKDNKIECIFINQYNKIKNIRIDLIHYLITLPNCYQFSKYLIKELSNINDNEYIINYIEDTFKYAALVVNISLKDNTILGNINFFKYSLTMCCKSFDAFYKILLFIDKYINKVVITKIDKNNYIDYVNKIKV